MAGLLTFMTNSQLDEQERRRREEQQAQEKQNQPLIQGIVAYVRRCWEAASTAKQLVERRAYDSLRQRNGMYDPSKLEEIRKHGFSTVYMMITEVKCRAAESWLRDILLQDGKLPWELKPTTLPEVSDATEEEITAAVSEYVMSAVETVGRAPTIEEQIQFREKFLQKKHEGVVNEAENRAKSMQRVIEDKFEEGGILQAFDNFLSDLVTFPKAFIKGPILRKKNVMRWSGDQIVVETTVVPEFDWVSFFDMYPEPGITSLEQGYVLQRHRMSYSDLSALIGVPGYDEQAIRQVLADNNSSSWIAAHSQGEREALENKTGMEYNPAHHFDVFEFWGKISGKDLLEWGVDPEDVPDPAETYESNVWVCGDWCIKAVVNQDPLGEKPYVATSFIKVPGSFWGKGIPEVIKDVQSICNAAARSLVNNMGIASGPQVEVEVNRLPANEPLTSVFPWKIWQVSPSPQGANAIRFNQPQSIAAELMNVYDYFSRLADEHSGIPAYIYGDTDVRGAGRTASGLSMLMGAAGKGIRQVVMYIDFDVIAPLVWRQFKYEMQFNDDNSIKGDLVIIPKGAVALSTKEVLDSRRLEFLTATANPVDLQIIGLEARADILREIAKSLKMPTEAMPTKESAAIDMRVAQALQGNQMQTGSEQAVSMPGGGMTGRTAADETNTVRNSLSETRP
ncbi:MAG: hypothetical protein QW318_07155 [Candidatus Caldarchaeum sp.]